MRKLIMMAAGAALLAGSAQAQTNLPSNVKPTCTVDSQTFDGWKDGTVITPANSTTFDDSTDCNFYIWGARMFLWLTSELSATDKTLVYNSDVMLDVVTDPDNTDNFNFVALESDSGDVSQFAPRKEKSDDETGTAQTGPDQGVLIAPNGGGDNDGTVVFYGVKANNVYAYYASGVQDPDSGFSADMKNCFPTTEADLGVIRAYAKKAFRVDEITAADALTMEIKTSWVEASTLPNGGADYITVDARIDTFDKSDTTHKSWPQNPAGDDVTTKMALVGMHVVGSAKNHPEMIWATFEHVNNAPQNSYVYIAEYDLSERITLTWLQPVGYDGNGGKTWTFNADPSVSSNDLPVQQVIERQSSASTGIVADTGQTIGPNTVVRINPWGDHWSTLMPPEEISFDYSSSNHITRATDLISLNRSIIGNLKSGDATDVRTNYIQTGSIWSDGGKDNIPTSGADPELRGNLRLANSTMETFHQYPDGQDNHYPQNCFGCHYVDASDTNKTDVSHIFDSMNPLVPPLQ